MYLIYLLLVFITASYIYNTYLPYFIDFNEYIFLLSVCLVYSLLYLLLN